MKSTRNIKHLADIEDEVLRYAKEFNRTLPEMRFFVTDETEFMSLLEKGVYPTSPPNFWEGQDMVKRKQRVESGQESSVYFEVVQTGNPSYAYLNNGNNDTMQASVMAHVVGHCEFSELNVMGDSDDWRTEWIMHLAKRVDISREKMGDSAYFNYWIPIQSLIPFINPNSRFNLENSVEDYNNSVPDELKTEKEEAEEEAFMPFSSTMNELFNIGNDETKIIDKANKKKTVDEEISRKGFNLKLPCEDIFGFLMKYAPKSDSEKDLLTYVYNVYKHQDFVRRTQIMNEGWAMYWEKEIMLKLFSDKTVNGVTDYAKCFSGVCYPRPFFQRNPYQMGFNMWHKIKERYNKGIYTPEYYREEDANVKANWDKPLPEGSLTDMQFMETIVKSNTDYNFINRFMEHQDIRDLYLNRVPHQYGINWGKDDLENEDEYNSYVKPEIVKDWMLDFFTSYNRPRMYVIDTDFENGGLLLYHRDDGKRLKEDWIFPTCANIASVWKAHVHVMSNGEIYSYYSPTSKDINELERDYTFDQVVEIMKEGKKVRVL